MVYLFVLYLIAKKGNAGKGKCKRSIRNEHVTIYAQLQGYHHTSDWLPVTGFLTGKCYSWNYAYSSRNNMIMMYSVWSLFKHR